MKLLFNSLVDNH